MSPTLVWLFTLLAIAAVLYIAEIFIPSHGVLTILATGCMVVVVALCFAINKWLGTGVMATLALLGPIGLAMGVSVWQRTPVGRKMVLSAVAGEPKRDFVLVGSHGRTVTELRPMGECEFGDTRIQARSELGQMVPPNQPVMAIALNDGVATVRMLRPNPTA